MWFFFLPSFAAILVIGFIQVRDELYGNPEEEATDPEETAVLVPVEVEQERGGCTSHGEALGTIEGV